ncbi:MAG: hypothetical protein PHE06_15275 [Lachnospiraceae bacterium]|nr:hypothetical protein [Lachnospiraceae bacterium]MDD3797296.1 hypothetical protein [Lachnospiraceae bacterium]
MKKKLFEGQRGILKKAGCLALAAIIAGTGLITYHNSVKTDIPELVTFTDPDIVTVAEDEVPLATGTKTTKTVTRKTTTKKTKMKTKAKKTATTTKTSTKQTNKTQKSTSIQVKTNTKVATTVKTSTKKKSNIKTTKTTVVTTVTTTTTPIKATAVKTNTSLTSNASNTSAAGTYNIKSVASASDARVLNAFTQMGCQLVVNPNVSYAGCFDASKRTITVRSLNSTVYHELGHFLEFAGGTSAVKQAIASAYNTEKSLYTAYNKAYVLQNSSEYFAESFKNYCENPSALQQARPNTYNAVVMALNNVTDARVNSIISVYSAIWK